ncbi:MAG: hypothetical protein WCK35_07425 [Chloroflexota bacterium]
MEVVDNQLRDLNPPETKETYDRLVSSGISDKEAQRLIGIVLSDEMVQMLEAKKFFNPERYSGNLRKLPKLPWE